MTDHSALRSEENNKESVESNHNLNYKSAADTEVQFSAFMTAVALFFIGLLLNGNPSYEQALQVPLIYLFVSSFAFFYSALIYANTSDQSPAIKKRNKDRNYQFNWANALSECLGVYCLGFAFPLTVVAYADGIVFPLVVLGVHVFGFVFYHGMGFSIIERNLQSFVFKVFTVTILTCYLISVYLYLFEYLWYFYIVSASLGMLLVLTFYLTGHTCLQPDMYD